MKALEVVVDKIPRKWKNIQSVCTYWITQLKSNKRVGQALSRERKKEKAKKWPREGRGEGGYDSAFCFNINTYMRAPHAHNRTKTGAVEIRLHTYYLGGCYLFIYLFLSFFIFYFNFS